MAALYRKYRPQTFADVVGQEAVVRTLSNAIEAHKIRQAYLFAGPRGTGKTSMARILAKSVNCAAGPTAHPDNTCPSCVSISNGTSLDVIEMDAASQRGIDDIRDIRDRVVLQPVEGRSKVYILDEAHQLTDAAWNALLKLIEEPPPHLLFIFCTTELQKVLPTVRSRCQTFEFQRPRLPELVRKLRLIADAEGITVPDTALALIARGGRGAFRDAESTLDQLSSATAGTISVQDVLQLLGAVEDEVLFRLCDLVVDGDSAGALVYVEELSAQGQDLSRLVTDLLEHLRHLMLVQHTGEVPDTLPVTDEARERLREQANQLGPAAVVRLIDLLHVAVDDVRQGGDPRLPLELALVKVTRPGSDLSREAIAYRLDRLEQGHAAAPVRQAPAAAAPAAPAPRSPSTPSVVPPAPPVVVAAAAVPDSAPTVTAPAVTAQASAVPALSVVPDHAPEPAADSPSDFPAEPTEAAEPPVAESPPPATFAGGPPPLHLDQLQEAWRRSVLPAVEERSIPAKAVLEEARPAALDGELLTVEFPPQSAFHRDRAEEPKNVGILKEALYEVTGRRLELTFRIGETPAPNAAAADQPITPEDIVELMKSTFDAQELEL